jgi:subtilisin family serine protease
MNGMLSIRLVVSVAIALPLAMAGGSGVAEELDELSIGEARYHDAWILVRLADPLGSSADGKFELPTGRPALDSAILETGIHRIEWALPVSMRSSRHAGSLRRYGLDRVYRFHVPASADIDAVLQRLRRVAGVSLAEPDFVGEAGVVPNDPRFDEQWGLDQTSDADMDAPEAWDIATGNGGVLIAVLDSGVDFAHEELAGRFWSNPGETPSNGIDDDGNGYIDDVSGWDFVNDDADPADDYGHGTNMASMISAGTNNGLGIAGACWDCPMLPVKIYNDTGTGTSSQIADGIIWATDQGARIISHSGGRVGNQFVFREAVGYAHDAGVVYVSITHNDGTNSIRYPARYVETIAVGATDQSDQRAAFSNSGAEIDVVAPGVAILSADMGGGYSLHDGTSNAAPVVSGLVGLMRSLDPSLGREEARHMLQSGAEDEVGHPSEDTPGFDAYHGWGRVNMQRALQAVQSATSLRVEGGASTRVYLETANPIAQSYDFVRGSLSALVESADGVDLGEVVCMENDSADADTLGNEDTEIPQPGEGFYYLARFTAAPGGGSYGGSSRNRDRETLPPGAAWSALGGQAGARLGEAAAGAGDVDGDGYDDLVVGARSFDGVAADVGALFVYAGSSTGLDAAPTWKVEGNQAGANLGTAVASAGDVNGDGYADVIAGAPYYDSTGADEGAAFVHHGSASGLEANPAWSAHGGQAAALFGWSVSGAGDVDGDGYDDVIVGARDHTAPEADEGKVSFYLGSASGLAATPDWTFESDQANAELGRAVGGAGDVNGDGYDDIVVGAPFYDAGQSNEGRVLVFLGSNTGPGRNPDVVLEIDLAGAQFGMSVAGAGDVDGDGYDDIVVTANRYAAGQSQEGAAFLFRGSAAGVETTHAWSWEADQALARTGAAAGAGDLNGDGYDDLVVGAVDFDARRSDDGRVWVFLGSATGLAVQPAWQSDGRQTGAGFGTAVGGAGDVNGDLLADVVVGAPAHNGDDFDEGRAAVFHGPPAPAVETDCPR